MQLQLLEGREMIPKVDAHDVGVIGHSFGGSLTLPMAERKPDLWAVVIFSGAGYRWDRSPELRARLLTAVENIAMAVLLIHASNDYSASSGKVLDAKLQQLSKPSANWVGDTGSGASTSPSSE